VIAARPYRGRVLRRLLPLLLLVAALAVPAAAAARPNVVVIMTDDQTVADLASMPNTRHLIGDAGVTFRNSFVSLSQCCPSRATFLTGQYAHNHHVLTTQPPFGGFPAFDDSQSLAVWLQRAGYATALVGKYLNGYGRTDPRYVPPGWTEWHGLLGPSTYRYTGFTFNSDGRLRTMPGWYETDAISRIGADIVRRRARGGPPLFLWMTYVAPHVGVPHDILDPLWLKSAVPSSMFRDAFLGTQMPRTAAFDEADVSDKPAAIRDHRPLGARNIALLTETWQKRQESLLSVDQGVVRIVRALRAAGALRNTLLVFTSDNGYMTGQHRVAFGKILPYEPSIRVPLMVRGPGIPAHQARSQLVFNGDLAPTILGVAGARAPWQTDGESLLPVIRDAGLPDDRDILLEGPPAGRLSSRPRFTGLRTPGHLYVEHETGEVELYDLRRDPDELRNLAGTPAAASLQPELAHRLELLRHCSGLACRSGSFSR
jgi:arylsulfatase A-like enzyme